MATDVTSGGIRVLPLSEAMLEMETLIGETMAAYGRAPRDSDARRAQARRLVALDMGLQALRLTKEADERHQAKARAVAKHLGIDPETGRKL